MIKFFHIIFLFISFNGFSQVTILDSTNLNGFTKTGYGGLSKYPDRIELHSSSSFNNTLLDTTLNLIGYDSIKVSFKAWRYGGAQMAFVNNISISSMMNTEYSYVTNNMSVLTLSCTLYPLGGGLGYLAIKNLNIIGYLTITSIKENYLTDNNEFIYYNNNLIYKGDINNQKLFVIDLYGNTIINKNLEKINSFNLQKGFYIIRVIKDERLLYTKKIVY